MSRFRRLCSLLVVGHPDVAVIEHGLFRKISDTPHVLVAIDCSLLVINATYRSKDRGESLVGEQVRSRITARWVSCHVRHLGVPGAHGLNLCDGALIQRIGCAATEGKCDDGDEGHD